MLPKVTGIGGIFIKSKDTKALAAWYEKHLGIPFGSSSYVSFQWINENPEVPGNTVFSFFKQDAEKDYFSPSKSSFMLNLRVQNIHALVENLRAAGVWVDEKVESFEYGTFAWTMDPDGNKIELWEPVDDKL